MTKATLMLLVKENKVLLARKKTGFGKGKIVAVGGRLEPGETAYEAAIRETVEELGVTPAKPVHVAKLDFNFAYKEDWSMQVSVFKTLLWRGNATESEEVKPLWFNLDALPFAEMWADGPHWLPRVLRGETLQASFYYASDNKSLERYEVNKGLGSPRASDS